MDIMNYSWVYEHAENKGLECTIAYNIASKNHVFYINFAEN